MKVFHIGLDSESVRALSASGFVVVGESVHGCEEVLEYLEFETYEAIVLDLDAQPWTAGLVSFLRGRKMDVPLLGVSYGGLHDWRESRALFLEMGGNDLLKRPLCIRELAASVRAIARIRNGRSFQDECRFKCGGAEVVINIAKHSVHVNGNPTALLTPAEFQLLALLAQHPGCVVKREDIIQNLYGINNEPESNSTEVMMVRIRKKMRDIHQDTEKLIQTVRGVGYMLDECEALDEAA